MTEFLVILAGACVSSVVLGALAIWFVGKVLQQSSVMAQRQQQPGTPGDARTEKRAPAATSDSLEPADRDNWEGSFWEVEEPVPVKARLRLRYVDGAGSKTERTVEVREFGSHDGSTLLIGHCLLRNETRTFRTDRILECVDEDTGEVISDVRSHLRKRYEESPERTRDALLEEEYDTLRILLYVGKADGQLRAPEKAIIRDACIAITKDSRLSIDSISEMLARMDVPTLQAFKLAVGRLASREGSSRSLVMDAAQRIVGTQKTIDPAEQEALDYMRQRFTAAG